MNRYIIKFCLLIAVMMVAVSCSSQRDQERFEKLQIDLGDYTAEVIPYRDPGMVVTPKGANDLDLEVPVRCTVNWKNHELIASIPYSMKAFNLVRNGPNDIMPRFEVMGLSFDKMPAEKAILKLTKEAGLKLIAADPPYASISAENLRGEFSDIVGMITDAAEIFYSYDVGKNAIKLSRKANFTLYVPNNRHIMMGLLDVIRGSGVTSITPDWSDHSITFDADYELKNKIMKLVSHFEDSPTLIAYDVTMFRVYPYGEEKDINWNELLDIYHFGTIKTAKTGVIGRVMTTSNELNVNSLRQFLVSRGVVQQIGEGRFIVPNLWMSRFDVGKCGGRSEIEAFTSILAKSSVEQGNIIFSNITLEGADGEITQFNIRSKFGENFIVFGLPNEVFGQKAPKSQTILFMMPRVVRTNKTTRLIQNQI